VHGTKRVEQFRVVTWKFNATATSGQFSKYDKNLLVFSDCSDEFSQQRALVFKPKAAEYLQQKENGTRETQESSSPGY
jgi:hypothetical protein